MEIIKASDMIVKGDYLPKFLLIGEFGSGKTTALKTMPPSWRGLVLDLFGNKESLEGAPNIDILAYSDFDPTSADAWRQIEKDKMELVSSIRTGKFPYQWIAIDAVTGLTRFLEHFVLFTTPEGKGIGGAPAMHHYRGMSHLSAQYITSFLSFPCAVVLICHAELNDPGEDAGGFVYKAIIAGKKMRNTIYSYVGEVYRCFGEPFTDPKTQDESTQYIWQTQPDARWPMLKSVMNKDSKMWGKYVEPNFNDLLIRRGVVKGKEKK